MPTWDLRAGHGCGIPMDREARRMCYAAENKWQAGRKDPQKAALDWAMDWNRKAEQSPFDEGKDKEGLRTMIGKKRQEIEKLLDTQWKVAEIEDKELKKKIHEFGKKFDTLGLRIDDVQKEYEVLTTTRKRAVERPLNKIDDLRKQQGLPASDDESEVRKFEVIDSDS